MNQIIENKRIYNSVGEPLLWAKRKKEILYKYDNNNYSKKCFVVDIIKDLKKELKCKLGLIPEKREFLDVYSSTKKIKNDFNTNIKEDIINEDAKDIHLLEIQKTFINLNLSKFVFDILIIEVIEILNLIQFSRRTNLFSGNNTSKSIYAYNEYQLNSLIKITKLKTDNNNENEFEDKVNFK